MHRGVIQCQAVRLFQMFAQPFSMIAYDHDQGAGVQPTRSEELQQTTDLLVDVGDLGVIRSVGEFVAEQC